MEHFRRLGIADQLRAEGLPNDVARASAYVTRFCGHEFGRLPRPYSDWPTPEIPNNVSQIVLERVLRRCAESQPGAQVHFGRRLTSFAVHDDHVVAEIEDTQTGERSRIKARYLLGIDGAGSMVRRTLGFGMTGEDGTTPPRLHGRHHAVVLHPLADPDGGEPPAADQHDLDHQSRHARHDVFPGRSRDLGRALPGAGRRSTGRRSTAAR